MTFNADNAADQLLPPDDPTTPDRTVALAALIAELTRRLNHAINDPDVFTHPQQVDGVIAALADHANLLPQLLHQLAVHMHAFAMDPRIGMDGLGPRGNPARLADAAGGALDAAADRALVFAAKLRTARQATAGLKLNDGEGVVGE